MVALSQYLARYFHTQALRRAEQGKKVPRQGPKIPWEWKSAITKELLRKRADRRTITAENYKILSGEEVEEVDMGRDSPESEEMDVEVEKQKSAPTVRGPKPKSQGKPCKSPLCSLIE